MTVLSGGYEFLGVITGDDGDASYVIDGVLTVVNGNSKTGSGTFFSGDNLYADVFPDGELSTPLQWIFPVYESSSGSFNEVFVATGPDLGAGLHQPITVDIQFAYEGTSSNVWKEDVSFTATNALGEELAASAVVISLTPYAQNPGNNDEWILYNGNWIASAGPGSHPSGYNIAGIGDWTGNGIDGILWFNPTTGDTDEWQLSNAQWSASVDLGTHPANSTDGNSYQIADIGDFFDTGIDDVLWTSVNANGTVATDIWELNSSGQWMASVSPGNHPAGYQVVGVGDFTGNGTSDILWQNPTTSNVDEWQLSNGKWAASVVLGSHPGSGWQIAGIGDFTGNSISDILWTNSSNGQVQTDIWELSSSGQWTASVQPGQHPAGYNVVGIGDFTGNGTDDILWQNPTTGDTDEWLIQNGKWTGSVDLGVHPGNFQIAGVGDFTGNGISSILWHAPS